LLGDAGNLQDLVRHGLHALRETLQQDKALSTLNTSIGILGIPDPDEKNAPPGGAFRILEGDTISAYLASMVDKENPDAEPAAAAAAAPASAPAPAPGDEDVQMDE